VTVLPAEAELGASTLAAYATAQAWVREDVDMTAEPQVPS